MKVILNGAGSCDPGEPFVLGHAAWLRALKRTAPLQTHPERTFPVLLDELADRFGSAPALLSECETLSFQELAVRANRYARWALDQELAAGSVIGLMMSNRPEYLAIWLGLGRVGCVTALLNTNLLGPSLAHCIDAAGMSAIIIEDSFSDILQSALPLSHARPKVWVHGPSPSPHPRIDSHIPSLSGESLRKDEEREVTLGHRALCIYTSGTTGLPKAANVSHHRIMSWSHWFGGMMDTSPRDRMYNCLPLYHAVGGVAANGALLCAGGSIFFRKKFSASQFWQEVCDNQCSIFQYIGELCRYLLKAPESEFATRHGLRLCCGNGLSGDIWHRFKERFNIPHILEFYAATEANFSLYNVDEEPGSIGRIPGFLSHRFPFKLVKVHEDTLTPIRNQEGLCIPAETGEAGEAVFRIMGETRAGAASFEGYTSDQDSDKKILCDVLAKGDSWFRSGDLMKRDNRGFLYFVDRIGDTFRWKGENVSTSEVAQALLACEGVNEAIVYSVAVPNSEGRAGMAAISIASEFRLDTLKAHLDRCLPQYAQPLFLRLVGSVELTSTFRPKKGELAAEGFDLKIADPVYFNHHDRRVLVKLDASLYESIVTGGIKL